MSALQYEDSIVQARMLGSDDHLCKVHKFNNDVSIPFLLYHYL